MRDRTPKMLDFLGLASQAQSDLKKAQKLPDVLELVNVAAREQQVKYIFVKE
jgi:hypothetical protein